MSHTKGKVKVGLFGLETPDWDRRTVFDEQDNFFADTETSTKTYEEEYANARRLVACWNLLLPFTTEEIEAGIDFENWWEENGSDSKLGRRWARAVWEGRRDEFNALKKEMIQTHSRLSVTLKAEATLRKENDALKKENEKLRKEVLPNEERYLAILEESKTELKSENEKLREAIQNFLDTCEATNPLINGPTFVAIDALHAVMEGK